MTNFIYALVEEQQGLTRELTRKPRQELMQVTPPPLELPLVRFLTAQAQSPLVCACLPASFLPLLRALDRRSS